MTALVICAAPETEYGYLKKLAESADLILCADAGVRYAAECGITPDIIIGDFDSYNGDIPNGAEVIRLDTHKDDTDALSCIKKALELNCGEIILACALGGRTDHTLANIACLDYMAHKGIKGKIVSANEEICLLKKGSYALNNRKGKTFSVFAFNCEACELSYKNAEYPLDNYRLSAYYPLGISNVFTDNTAEITVHSGGAVLIINS